MAEISAAKRRYREGRNGKIMDSKFFFLRPRGESVAGFLNRVVYGNGSAFSVMDIWGMRDDAPPRL
jgi:hypothetical protein